MADESVEQQTADILKDYTRERKNLIPILQNIQFRLHYLPMEAMEVVARFLEVPGSVIYSIATFYNQFRLTPPGKHPIRVCLGTACHMKSGERIVEAWERGLGIKVGEVTPDREFDLERVACVGCCAMAPVAVIDETIHGKISPTKIEGILAALKREDEHELHGD